jgi:UDP-N-acetylmuramyl pentapeptide phosphotransferase/UDP-N-acetylglucosamine-1-phosphate transferase
MVATSLAVSVPTALGVGLLLQPLVLRLMTAAAVIDVPCARSSHAIATPRGGGVAVGAAAAAGLLLFPPTRMFAVPLLLFAAIGLLEDVRGAAVSTRLTLLSGAAVITALVLAPWPPTTPVAFVLVLALACWLTAYPNAFNFMDGVNGMSAVHAALAGGFYVLIGVRYDAAPLTVAGAVTAAAAVTFLPWNANRARIFLGDVGSYGLGGLLASLAAYGVLRGVPVEAVLAPLALYLADTGWTLLRRWHRGEPWHQPHRTHTYQRLTDVGWSHPRVSLVTAAVSATVCACAWIAATGGPPARTAINAVAAALLVGYLAAPYALGRRPGRRGRQEHRAHA